MPRSPGLQPEVAQHEPRLRTRRRIGRSRCGPKARRAGCPPTRCRRHAAVRVRLRTRRRRQAAGVRHARTRADRAASRPSGISSAWPSRNDTAACDREPGGIPDVPLLQDHQPRDSGVDRLRGRSSAGLQRHQSAGADARSGRAEAAHRRAQRSAGPDDDGIVGEMVRRAAAIANERGIAAAGYRTVFNTNQDAARRCSTSTCTCSADERWRGRRDRRAARSQRGLTPSTSCTGGRAAKR